MKRIFPLLILLAAPGAAQQGNHDIVVTGRANATPAEALSFVTGITDTEQGQIARFHKPVCPMVQGLPAGLAESIATRIRETAQKVGADLASTPCEANLILVVTDDGRKYLSDVRRKHSEWLWSLSSAAIRSLADDKAPVRAWAVVSARNEDGVPVENNDLNQPQSSRAMNASILRPSMRLDIEGAFVVIDKSAIGDKTEVQIADYAAMRGLARTRPAASGSIGTILSLFEGGGSPSATQLTRPDLLYLQSLYQSKGTEGLIEARSRLSRDIVR